MQSPPVPTWRAERESPEGLHSLGPCVDPTDWLGGKLRRLTGGVPTHPQLELHAPGGFAAGSLAPDLRNEIQVLLGNNNSLLSAAAGGKPAEVSRARGVTGKWAANPEGTWSSLGVAEAANAGRSWEA